jgi:hypothetical protein
MTATINVILDAEDDIATTRAIHRLAATQPGVLAVTRAPHPR